MNNNDHHFNYYYNNITQRYKTYVCADSGRLNKPIIPIKYEIGYKIFYPRQKCLNVQPIDLSKRITDDANEQDLSNMDNLPCHKTGPIKDVHLTCRGGLCC